MEPGYGVMLWSWAKAVGKGARRQQRLAKGHSSSIQRLSSTAQFNASVQCLNGVNYRSGQADCLIGFKGIK